MDGNYRNSGYLGDNGFGEHTRREEESVIFSLPPLWKRSPPVTPTKASPVGDPRLLPTMVDLQRGINRRDLESGNPIGRMNYNSGYLSRTKFNPRCQKIDGNSENSGNSDEIEFRAQTHQDESGVSSPPLWKTTSPPLSPTTPKAFPVNHHHQYLSSTPRSLAIARGRRELMEMIKNMPESAYELSLKDIVESPTAAMVRQETVAEDVELTNQMIEREKKKKKKKKVKRQVSRTSSGSMDNGGFLLKMFFPTSLGLKRSSRSSNTCSKVSPRPILAEGEKVGVDRSVDGEWWKRRFSLSSDNEGSRISRGSSRSNSSSGSRHISGFLPGCWTFFHTIKSRTREQ
eukprot:TRINITY_DN5272_c1_g1_i1.p1 TRINITY_DN5272_c1_g1~~TRINITY_DN5272_c1_g1_i1.p1  ORF type:complete len:344 (+),score=58.60 TRINITY_DN5272_c1_g1_i1:353-1384(+)